MTEEQIKDKILTKYGSIKRFLLLSGLKYINFYRMLKGDRIDEVEQIVKKTKNNPIPGYDVTQELRDKIRIEILKRYKNMSEFGKAHGYYDHWLSNLINANMVVMTPKVKNLCKILNIKTGV